RSKRDWSSDVCSSDLYCHTYQLSPRIDPTNFEQIYTRNKIRHTILPTLKEVNSNVHTTIQRLSETLQEDELYLLEQAESMKKDRSEERRVGKESKRQR